MTAYCLYCRVSKGTDGRTETIPRQVREITAKLAETGDTVCCVHTDKLSAWKKSVRRPGFDRVTENVLSGHSSHLMVWNLDRLARRPYDFEKLIEFAERGLVIRSMLGELDISNRDALANARVLLAFAAKSSDDTSARVKSALIERAASGSLIGGRGRLFGYNLDGTMVAAEAEILREARLRALAKEPWSTIITDFERRGIVTATTSDRAGERGCGGVPFTRTTLRRMMARPVNHGEVRYRGKSVAQLPEAIFTEEQAAEIITLLASRRPGRQPSGRYLLTGKIFCGACDRSKRGGTKDRRVYRCDSLPNARCARSVSADAVEKLVGEKIKAALRNPDYMSRLRLANANDDSEAARYTDQIRRTQLALSLADERFGTADDVSPDVEAEYLRTVTRLRSRLVDLRARLAAVSDPARIDAQRLSQAEIAWDGPRVTPEDRRRLVEGMVRRITIGPADTKSGRAFLAFDPARVRIEMVMPVGLAPAAMEETA